MKLKVASTLYRTATFERAEGDSNKLRLSISSDVPYKRYDWDEGEYWEILDHGSGGIMDERLNAGMPLLFNHKRDVVLGRSEGYTCDGHKCYIEPTLSGSDDVKGIVQQIKEGTLRDASVGYEIVGKGVEVGTKDGLPMIKCKWRVFEGSIVSIPADNSVGVGRMRELEKSSEPREIEVESKKAIDSTIENENNSQKREDSQSSENTMKKRNFLFEADKGDNPTTGTATAADVTRAKQEGEKAGAERERKRVSDIQELSRHFLEKGLAGRKIDTSAAAEAHIKDEKKTVSDFQTFVMTNEFKDVKPLETPTEEKDLAERGFTVVGERDTVIQAKSLGELFVKSKAFLQRSKANQECRIEIDSLSNFRATFATSSVTNFNGIVQIPNIYELGVQRPTVADLMGQGTTNLAAVPYMQETSITNAATTVAEGGAKPEATFALTQTSAPVKKIAVTIPVTDEAFEDIATLQSYIDGRLRWMVETTEEAQLINGDGVGPNLTGILQTAGIQTQAKGADVTPDAIFKAITKVRSIGFAEPSGMVIHPNDWQDLRLLKDGNQQYYGGGPFTGSYGTPLMMVDRFWGQPVVITTGIPENTALVGAFRMDSMIFRRKGITIDSTNSNASEFVNNIVRLRAEERLALAVFRPKSFCQITGI